MTDNKTVTVTVVTTDKEAAETVMRVYREVTGYNTINTAPQGARSEQETSKAKKYIYAVSILIIYALSVFLILQGKIHIKDCPAQEKLPIIMIVLGVFLLFPRLFMFMLDYKSVFRNEDEYDVPKGLRIIDLLFKIVAFALFITMCVYCFVIDPTTKPEDQGSSNYCDSALYLSGYYLSIGFVVTFVLGLCYGCIAIDRRIYASK